MCGIVVVIVKLQTSILIRFLFYLGNYALDNAMHNILTYVSTLQPLPMYLRQVVSKAVKLKSSGLRLRQSVCGETASLVGTWPALLRRQGKSSLELQQGLPSLVGNES